MLPCSWHWSFCMLLSWGISLFPICMSFNVLPVLFVGGDPHSPVSLSCHLSVEALFCSSILPSVKIYSGIILSFFPSFILFMFFSFSRLFCSSCLEALSHPVAGVLPFPLGRPPRPSLWPLNISTSQVGAGASSKSFSAFFPLPQFFNFNPLHNAYMLFLIYCLDCRFCLSLMLRTCTDSEMMVILYMHRIYPEHVLFLT